MPRITCAHVPCSTEFFSKHSTAKYCSRSCAGTASMQRPEVAERQRMRMRKYSDEELLQFLRDRAHQLGRTPGYRELRNAKGEGPSVVTITTRFGSFNAAVLKAGLVPNIQLPGEYFEGDRANILLSTRFAVLKRDEFRCQYCGGTPQEGYVLHVDHKVAVSKGGATEMDNLITACWLCNLGKSNT